MNLGRLKDALAASRLHFQCGKCSTEYRVCSVPELLQGQRCSSQTEMLQRKKAFCSNVGCLNQPKFERAFAVCAGLKGCKNCKRKRSGESQRIQLEESSMKGLNFRKSVREEILVLLTQLASKY